MEILNRARASIESEEKSSGKVASKGAAPFGPIATGLRRLDLWLKQLGVCACTGWRWRKKGWLRTQNINGRQYISQEAIDEFNRRAAAGEFALVAKVPTRTGLPA